MRCSRGRCSNRRRSDIFYSKCADPACPEPLLQVSYAGQESHPGCRQTEAETLARQFVDAVQRGDQAEASRLEKLVNKIDEPPSLGSAALWYAGVGWPVLPLVPGEKRPLTAHGLKDASVEPAQIREWWGRWPNANIGVRTGVRFDVIDIDTEVGLRSLAELGDDVLPDIHGKALTPRGVHYFVTPTGSGNRAAVRPGIDYRGASGFCVVAPSVVDGKKYSWAMKPSPKILDGKW